MNLLKTILIVIFLQGTIAYSQIGIQTNTPDASSALDIVSTNKGLLIPRVTLTSSLSSPLPVTSPATGLMVFNTGANQPIGLYFWNGSYWNLFTTGVASTDYWNLAGNAGTTVGTNFIGTTDNVSFAINTNNTERMRFLNGNGEIVIGNTTPYADDKFSVYGAAGNYGINSYGSDYAFYGSGNLYGIYTEGGSYSMRGETNNSGLSAYFRNNNVSGNGVLNCGANIPGTYWLAPFNAGTVSLGNNGINTIGYHSSGNGILASGSGNITLVTIATGTGGTFVGYHGVYGKGINATNGTGIIGTGNNLGSYSTLINGSGGSFYGYDGLFGKAANNNGIGVIGLGNNGGTYYYIPAGSGGAFTGFHGIYGQAVNSSGTGVVGNGNNSASTLYAPGGSGGAFTGNDGIIASAITSSGTGVIGIGNNTNIIALAPTGSGGAFTGDVCGVFGYATNSSGDRYGAYFQSNGGLYAYVGGRYSGTNRKIVGTGTVSTIVKNTKGEIVTLVCPEAPEAFFQDFGMGQLVNGFAHITIDPDLAININVSEDHPLKVYITVEGDCRGVYVTNKSANGFDVIELQGGNSNVDFSWQIVAIRANEETILRDGSVEISDYSKRFQPAPPPMSNYEENLKSTSVNTSVNNSSQPEVFQSKEIKPVSVIDTFSKESK